MKVLHLIWDNITNAIGDMFLYGCVAFLVGMLMLFLLNRTGGLSRKTVSGKMLSGCYYFLIPFLLSLGFAIFGGVNGAKREVIRDAHLTIDKAAEETLGRFDNYLKEKDITFSGHGFSNDSIASSFVDFIGTDEDSWKGALAHWTVSTTLDQVEQRIISETSSRSGIDEEHVKKATDFLEEGSDGKEIGELQAMGSGIAKKVVTAKVRFWVDPYLWMIAIITIVLTLIPLSHCIIHLLIVRFKKPKKEELLEFKKMDEIGEKNPPEDFKEIEE